MKIFKTFNMELTLTSHHDRSFTDAGPFFLVANFFFTHRLYLKNTISVSLPRVRNNYGL